MSTKRPDSGSPVSALVERFDRAIALLGIEHTNSPMLIGYSGGMDSHVLLQLAAGHTSERCVRAVYIDHQLQRQSGDWAVHCRAVCEKLAVEFDCIEVVVPADSERSPEEAARDARYAALASHLQCGELLLTAHHQNDQAETLLLQLLRGAGVDGLAAMPAIKPFSGGWHARPLLEATRAEILQFATSRRLRWIQDQSNADTRYDRNYLRQVVMPVLTQRWPAASRNVARSAGHCAESSQLCRTMAARQLGDIADAQSLGLRQLLALPLIEQKNALRHWIGSRGLQQPSERQLQHIVHDVMNGGGDVQWGDPQRGGAQIRGYGGSVFLARRGDLSPVSAFAYDWPDLDQPLLIAETGQLLSWDDINLPPRWRETGVTGVSVRSRRGGERIRLAGRTHSTSVKKLLQQRGIPPWERSRLGLVYRHDRLVGIIGVGFADSSVWIA